MFNIPQIKTTFSCITVQGELFGAADRLLILSFVRLQPTRGRHACVCMSACMRIWLCMISKGDRATNALNT